MLSNEQFLEMFHPHLLQGPGTELKKLLAGLGIEPGKCSCNSMVLKMNRWGIAGTREHMAEIVDHLESQARSRGWKFPAMRFGAAALVRLAIWKTRRSSPSTSPHPAVR